MVNRLQVGVIGSGAWGTALAQIVAGNGHDALLYTRRPETAAAINGCHENAASLPGVRLNSRITATIDAKALANASFFICATRSQELRAILGAIPVDGRPLVLCCKGLEAGSHMLMSQVAAEVQPRSPVLILSGPTFAGEIALDKPAAVTLASQSVTLGNDVAACFCTSAFRIYQTSDVIGTQIGGAVKNVIAIACGAASGANLGDNARAALIARGFAEMMRFGLAKGARAETMSGLSGLGDLVLTCSSPQSRNYALGLALAAGNRADMGHLVSATIEGASAAQILSSEAKRVGVDMPIANAVADLLAARKTLIQLQAELLGRPNGTE